MPAPEAGATPRTPLAWVRRAACLLLLALTASLPLAGTAQAQSDFPAPVTDLTATPGNAQVTLHWVASENAAGYRIRHHAIGYASIPPFPVDVTGTRHTFRNLMNNVEYVFEVSAMNNAGWESDPATVNAISVEDGAEATPPGQVGYVLLQPGDGQIEASWSEPGDNGGLPVTGYRVEYRAGSGSWQTWPHSGAATTTTITGLSNGTGYDMRVAAINGAGTGPASAPEYATPEQPPEPTTPNQVTGLRLTAGDAQIAASWNAPPDGGSPLTGYRVEYQAGNGSWQQWTHSGTGRNATLTGLTNDTSYGVRVSAINAIGTGPASAVRRATPTDPSQPSVPGKPVVTLTPGNAEIEVEWTEPANNGAAISDYDVRYRAGTSGGWTDKPHTGTTRSTTIDSLNNGQLYQLQVLAKNSAGSGAWSDVKEATPASKSLVLSETSRTVLEDGGTATWTVGLSEQPSGNVTVKVTGSAAAKVCEGANCTPGNPGTEITLTFTNANWTAKTVKVTGVDDTSQNTDNKRDVTVNHDTETGNGDNGYDNKTGSVAVRVVDDETATVANSFLSTVMVAGEQVTTITRTGYLGTNTPPVGLATADELIGAGTGNTLVQLFENSDVPGRPIIRFHSSSGDFAYLPSPLNQQFVVQVGSGSPAVTYRAESHATATRYQLVAGSTLSFAEGDIYELHLLDVTPKNVAAAPGNASLTVTWTNTTGAASYSVRHRVSSPQGAWTTATNKSSGYEITGLTNGTEYDVQVGAVFGSGPTTDTYWSPTVKATPAAETPGGETLLDTYMTVGSDTPGSGFAQLGYDKSTPHGTIGDGTQAARTITIDGTSYELITLKRGGGDGLTYFKTDPQIPMATFKTLKVTVKDKVYTGEDSEDPAGEEGWCCDARTASYYIDNDGLALAQDEVVTITIAEATSDGPDAPTGFTATPAAAFGAVDLAWEGPSDNDVTKWQYRQKAGSGSYGNWTDVPSSGAATRGHTVTGLTHDTEYSFQVRAFTTARGSSSAERKAKPGPGVQDFMVTAGGGQVVLSWANPTPTDSSITGWQASRYDHFQNAWTNWATYVSDADARTVTDTEPNGDKSTWRMRAELTSNRYGPVSETRSATPEAPGGENLLDTNMNTKESGSLIGYSTHRDPDFGAMGDITFTYSGTDYTITEFVAYTSGFSNRRFCIRTTPTQISAANLMALEITVGDRTFIDDDSTNDDDWKLPGGDDACRDRDHADGTTWDLAKGETVTVAIEEPTSDGPDAPTGFSASSSTTARGVVELAWNDPGNSDITKYQYRRKAGSGSYGNWTDMGGSGATTTSYTVTGLTHGTTYTFQMRAYTTARGSASVERSVTSIGVLLNTTMTVGCRGTNCSGTTDQTDVIYGFSRDPNVGSSSHFGSLGDETFIHDNTTYTIVLRGREKQLAAILARHG